MFTENRHTCIQIRLITILLIINGSLRATEAKPSVRQLSESNNYEKGPPVLAKRYSNFPIAETPKMLELENRLVKRDTKSFDPNTPVDVDFDMELAEINVFRPLFSYRIEYAKQVKSRQRQFE